MADRVLLVRVDDILRFIRGGQIIDGALFSDAEGIAPVREAKPVYGLDDASDTIIAYAIDPVAEWEV